MTPITADQLAAMPSYESIGMGPLVKLLLTPDERAHLVAALREHEERAAQWVDICIIEPTAPFITNVSAGWGKPALDSIEDELIDGDWENLPGVPSEAVSVRYKANHCAAQIGDEGRVELPAYWDLTPIGYEVMDDAGVTTYAAVEKAVRG